MENDPASNQADVSFDEIILSLRDEGKPFPARYLYHLSSLEGEQLGLLGRVWFGLSAERRLGILEDLETLADSNTVLHFDAVNKIAFGDEDPRVRVTAIRALWTSEETSLIPKFIELLDEDESVEVRAQAAAGLGRFVYLGEVGKLAAGKFNEVQDKLLATLAGEIPELIQRRALESLGYSSRPEVAELIEKAYGEDSEEWTSSALYAMGRSADDRWAPLIIERLSDSNVVLSREAARAAGELELEDALPSLIELLQEEDSELRLAAAWALSQIGGEGAGEALEDLLERTEDEDEIDLIEDAVENLAFTHEMEDLNILDFSAEDLEDLVHPDGAEMNGDEEELDE